MVPNNPFLIEGYVSPEYFCDRVDETAMLVRHLTNGCNVALIAPRRLGKSGLILNSFHQEAVRDSYYTIFVDIYETKNFAEFVNVLGKGILDALRTRGRKVWEVFLAMLKSLRSTISFDMNGVPEWNVGVGDIINPVITLDEIFDYLAQADRPCLVAIDEFQTIASYPEKTVEAALRTRIQRCGNARFVFSGSKRYMMAQMFATGSRPFYNSSVIMGLEPIGREVYFRFANHHLSATGKSISADAFAMLYDAYDGVTWYVQYVLNMLYTRPAPCGAFGVEDVRAVIREILAQHHFVFQSLLYKLTVKQKQVLVAVATEGKAKAMMSQAFLRRHHLGASTVQGALKALTERDFITQDDGVCQLSDRFFEQWLRERG